MQTSIPRRVVRLALIVTVGTAACTAFATPLNLVQAYPDVFVTSNAAAYDPNSMQFTETGRPLTYSLPTSYNITNTTTTSYSLTATIDHTGSATGGTLSILGKISALGFTSGTLLTGTLAPAPAFGYGNSTNGDPFEFLFTVTGGDMAGDFGSTAGVIISAKSTNYVDWSHSFSNGSGATNDTFRVPEPASLILLATVVGLSLRRGR